MTASRESPHRWARARRCVRTQRLRQRQQSHQRRRLARLRHVANTRPRADRTVPGHRGRATRRRLLHGRPPPRAQPSSRDELRGRHLRSGFRHVDRRSGPSGRSAEASPRGRGAGRRDLPARWIRRILERSGGADRRDRLLRARRRGLARHPWCASGAPGATAQSIGGQDLRRGRRRTGETTAVASLFVYDPAGDSWTAGTAMPAARSHVASCVVGGKMIVGGGFAGEPPVTLATVQRSSIRPRARGRAAARLAHAARRARCRLPRHGVRLRRRLPLGTAAGVRDDRGLRCDHAGMAEVAPMARARPSMGGDGARWFDLRHRWLAGSLRRILRTSSKSSGGILARQARPTLRLVLPALVTATLLAVAACDSGGVPGTIGVACRRAGDWLGGCSASTTRRPARAGACLRSRVQPCKTTRTAPARKASCYAVCGTAAVASDGRRRAGARAVVWKREATGERKRERFAEPVTPRLGEASRRVAARRGQAR